ncbi:MAG: LemA family protein [Acidimicrobiia bacterium]|nr:LemA family protein [Acidimicrobiia bacterium]
MSAPGWYPSPAGDAWWWWDGTRWIDPAVGAPPREVVHPPGWYHDADEVHLWRWWDGHRFTGHTARYRRPRGVPSEETLDGHVVVKQHGRYGMGGRTALRQARDKGAPVVDAPHLLGRRQHGRKRLVASLAVGAFVAWFAVMGIAEGGTFFDPALLVFPGVAAVGVFFWAWGRRVLVVDTPTVEAAGAHPTRCEVAGEVHPIGAPVHGWVTGTPSVRTRTTVTVRVGSGKNSHTYVAERIEAGSSLAEVRDHSGALRVDVGESDQRALWVTTFDERVAGPVSQKGRWSVQEQCIVVGTDLWCSGPVTVGLDGRLLMARTDPTRPGKRAEGPFWTSMLGVDRIVAGQNAMVVAAALVAAVCMGVAVGVGAEWEPTEEGGFYLWYRREGVFGPFVGVLGTLAVLFGVGTLWRLWNRLVALRQQAEMAWANIEAAVTQRHDLLPRLAETLGEAMRYERVTTESLTAERTQAVADEDTERLVALAEGHPELRTAEQSAQVFDQLVATENRIAAHRRFYNDAVTLLDTRASTWPGLLFAPLLGSWRRRELFRFEQSHDPVPPASW